MRIVFLGSGAFGLPTLRALVERHDVALVVTQPDRRAGRGKRVTPTPVGAWAAEAGVETVKTGDVNAEPDLGAVRAAEADAWVIVAFGQKLSPELLRDRFAINLHASLLPRWRGAAPINHAVLAGDAETGDSVITIADRMDAGEVLARSRRPIEPTQTAGDLHDLLAEDGAPLILETLARAECGGLEPIVQDDALATRAPKLRKADGWVNFADAAGVCRRRVNGLSPWPAVTVRFRNDPLKILRSQALAGGAEQPPGAVVDAGLGTVACGEGLLRLIEVQPAGKKAMSWDEFARGRRVEPGERFESGAPS